MSIKSSSVKSKPLSLTEVQSLFKHWRETRSKKGRIPEKLWDAAVSLSETCTINQISKALHLSHSILRDRIHMSKLKKSAGDKLPTFVELNLQPYNMKECLVKMETENGTKMEIQFNECSVSNLLEFCSALWRRRA